MKVAIVHDYIKEYGGAERVLEVLHEVFPDAPVYTTVYLPKFLGPHKDRFKDWNIRTSMAQLLPFKAKLISPLRIIAPLLFKSFDYSGFDVVIVSATGAYLPNSIRTKNEERKTKNPLQICYCHTPPRYLYGFATAREWKNNLIFRVFGEFANHFLRLVDFKSAQNVDFFIANSQNVAGRIKKFYRKDSVVIYPPATLSLARRAGPPVNHESRKYYLAGGRLARPKHIDLIVETFSKLKLPLKIFGRGFAGYELDIKSKVKSQKSKVEFVGEVSDEEKLELMRNAKAFIFASEDEDFGITPVEAMSVGTPVIAYRSGGVLESVIENKTGLFFDELSIKSLSDTVRKFDKMSSKGGSASGGKFNPQELIKYAHKFSKERFKREIREFVNNLKF